jgi:hypothetical protein
MAAGASRLASPPGLPHPTYPTDPTDPTYLTDPTHLTYLPGCEAADGIGGGYCTPNCSR